MISLSDLADLIQDVHIATARNLEQETIRTATGRAEDLLADAVAGATAAWIRDFGSVHAPGHGPELDRIIDVAQEQIHEALLDLVPRARRAAYEALPEATRLGIEQTRQTLEELGQRAAGYADTTVKYLRQAEEISGDVARYLEIADRILSIRPTAFPRVLAAVQTARTAVTRVQTGLGWLLNLSVNSGAAMAADALGVGLLWVAEPDACVRCAAYSGRTTQHGQSFPGGLSYDPKQRTADAKAIEHPPLHPHCRCRVIPWSESWPLGTRFPRLLRRQADRSVARGLSLPSEAGPARVRAARDLLNSGRPLPPRVAARARDAVAAGRFGRR
ncbi:hypothetical protein [Kitasatospora sp. NPDC047058]|uniref:hypothetical protein n=1 Tax=Kitasatospora sp. NPDC047058 TaxID=3155620 RepID=UPI0033CC001B